MKKWKSIGVLMAGLVISNILAAQNHEWTLTSGSTGGDGGTNVCTDNFGNVFTSGTFQGTVDFDPGVGTTSLTGTGSFDNFLAKYDANGNLLWVKHYYGNLFLLNEIMTNLSGDLFLVGAFTGTLDADPNAGTFNLTSNGSRDIFVIRLSSAGNFLWAKNVGAGGADVANALTVDNLSNVIIGGYFSNTVDFDPGTGVFNLTSSMSGDAFLLKLDQNGNFSFADNIARSTSVGSYAVVTSIDTDDATNIFYTGYFGGSVDLNPDNTNDQLHTSAGSDDIFIGMVDPGGNFNWGKVIGSAASERTTCLRNDFVNQIYITGNFTNVVDFDASVNVNNLFAIGGIDAFSLVMTTSGNFVIANQMGGLSDDYGYAIETTYDGFLVTGSFQDDFSYIGGSSVSVLGGGGGTPDIFLEKMDFSGNHMWTRTWTGPGSDIGRKVAFSSNEKIFVAGSFQQSVDFDPSAGTNILSATGTSSDYFLTKLKCPNTSSFNDTYCYSYVSPSGNHTWTTDGTYLDTIQNVFGCDSVMTITINGLNNGASANVQGCGQYISPSGNYTWTNTGNYLDTIPNMNGCDSVLNLNVTIIRADTTVSENWQGFSVPSLSGATYQWYYCGVGTQVPGETLNYLNPQFNNQYYVEITYNGCVFESGCHGFTTVGMDEIEGNSFSVYPNPANSFIHLNSSLSDYTIEIMDLTGRVVLNQKYSAHQIQINVSDLANGKYLIRMISGNGIFMKPFIKE